MRRIWNALPLLALVFALMTTMATSASGADLTEIADREELTIVVTDSGLGGLSVAADIARRVEAKGSHRSVNVIFYNALFDAKSGYNSLPSRAEQVRIFNNALEDMGARYQPDLIMVACNTLSVLLPDCEYAQSGEVPVLGIVEAGVELVEAHLARDPEAAAVIFATPATVEDDSHRTALVERGIESDRIVPQACRDLTFYIEQEFDGFDTELMIAGFVNDVMQRLGDSPPPIYASFNCTHFGYSADLWKQEIEAAGLTLKGLLDPNERMSDFLFDESRHGRFEDPEVSVRFVTMVPLSESAIASIGRAVRPTSPRAAEALENHELVPDLFEWKKAAEETGG